MKKIPLVLVFLLFASALFAQDSASDLPDIQVPSIIMEMDQVTIGETKFGIPEDGKLASSFDEVALPELGALEIKEPILPFTLPGSDIQFPSGVKDQSLAAEAILGVGLRNQLTGNLLLYHFGTLTGFEFRYTHEGIDGFAGQPAGSSYYKRADSLGISINSDFGALAIGAKGAFIDSEAGLQSNPAFDTRIHRLAELEIDASYLFRDLFRLSLSPKIAGSALLLKGANPERYTELLTGADFLGELFFKRFKLGLASDYDFRTLMESTNQSLNFDLHRVSAQLFFGIELPFGLRIDGRGGWRYSTDMDHRYVFSLGVTGTPHTLVSFSVAGGYRIIQLDLYDVFKEYEFVDTPANLADNQGWYGSVAGTITILRNMSARVGFDLAWNSAQPYPDTYDATRGFFPLLLEDVVSLEPELGFDWRIADIIDLGVSWQGRFYDDTNLVPWNRMQIQVAGEAPSDTFGGGLEALLILGPNRDTLLPEINLDGFYRFSKNIKVVAEAADLLSPLLGNEYRHTWNPYQDVGLTATLKIQIGL